MWHDEDRLEIHPHDAEERGVATATGSASQAAPATPCCARAITERVQPGVVYTTFHFPESGANVITTENSDWATNCPEYKVTAVQVMPVTQPSVGSVRTIVSTPSNWTWQAPSALRRMPKQPRPECNAMNALTNKELNALVRVPVERWNAIHRVACDDSVAEGSRSRWNITGFPTR